MRRTRTCFTLAAGRNDGDRDDDDSDGDGTLDDLDSDDDGVGDLSDGDDDGDEIEDAFDSNMIDLGSGQSAVQENLEAEARYVLTADPESVSVTAVLADAQQSTLTTTP